MKNKLKKFNDFINENQEIDDLKQNYQTYQEGKRRIDTMFNNQSIIDDEERLSSEFEKIKADSEGVNDLLTAYYSSKKLEMRKEKMEQEIKDIIEELNNRSKELTEMENKLK